MIDYLLKKLNCFEQKSSAFQNKQASGDFKVGYFFIKLCKINNTHPFIRSKLRLNLSSI